MASMTASTDSTASKFLQAIRPVILLASCAVLFVCLGCSRFETESSPSASLESVAPELVTRHGQLRFVEDLDVGRRLSEELGKPCLLFFTAEWCTYCRQMEETAFTDTSVGDLSDNFICVLVDADLHPQTCEEFSVTGFPTIQFVSANGRALNRLVGRQSAPDLATGMQSALKRFAWINDPDTRVR